MGLIGGVIRNSSNHVALPFASACLTGTLNCASTDGYGIWNATWGYEGVSVSHGGGGFFDKTVNYTAADIAWFAAYGAYGYWKVVEIDPKPQEPTCCFTGPTLIHMADGSRKPIAQVAVGEYVIGRDGALSRVISVEKPLLGNRRLYGINRGDPFVTGEHPFLTDNGWRAIDLAALEREHRYFPAKKLEIGHKLLFARAVRIPVMSDGEFDQAELDVEEVRMAALDGVRTDEDITVYNLLLDGDHTYIANGYIVHNKTSSH